MAIQYRPDLLEHAQLELIGLFDTLLPGGGFALHENEHYLP
jgi:hypothetical protein